MSLSSSVLSAIQKAGATVFAADTKLKNATKEYADRVNSAIGSNPYGLGNDALFENWKTVARLSQTMAKIEEEIKKVFQIASELTADDRPSVVQILALAAPTSSVKKNATRQTSKAHKATNLKTKRPLLDKTITLLATAPVSPVQQRLGDRNDLMPTDVRIKSKMKISKSTIHTPAVQVSLKKKVSIPKTSVPASIPSPAETKSVKPVKAIKRSHSLEISGNPAKLLRHLERVLNTHEFTAINQTTAGQETGIPSGSMSLSVKKLIATGRIIAGPTGSFMLANAQPPLTT